LPELLVEAEKARTRGILVQEFRSIAGGVDIVNSPSVTNPAALTCRNAGAMGSIRSFPYIWNVVSSIAGVCSEIFPVVDLVVTFWSQFEKRTVEGACWS